MSDFDVQGAKAAGYSDAEIADHLAASKNFDAKAARAAGYSDSEILSHLVPPPSLGEKVMNGVNTAVNVAGTGLAKGFANVGGAIGDVRNLANSAADWVGQKVGDPGLGEAYRKTAKVGIGSISPKSTDLNVFTPPGVKGPLALPETNAADISALKVGPVNFGSMIDSGIKAVPSMMAGGAPGILPAFAGGVTSDMAGQAAKDTPYETPARILGSIPGFYLGQKATTPFAADLTPQQARAVDLAKSMDVPLSVAQETGRGGGLERLFSRMPGGQGLSEAFARKQGGATDKAALATAGFEGNEVGQETMKKLATQAGGEFEVAKNMPGLIDLTPTFPKVKSAVADYENIMDPAKRSSAVTNEAGRILSKEPGGAPSYPPLTATAVPSTTPTMGNLTTAIKNASKPVGEAFDALPTTNIKSWFSETPNVPMPKAPPELSNVQYQTLRTGLSKAVDGLYAAGDTNGAKALQAMRNSIDEAAGASLGPQQAAAWQSARLHYFNFKVLEKAMNGGTTAARSEGTLGAAALDRALKSKQGDAYYRTTGGLNDVATVKGYLRDTFPNSGTPTVLAQAAALANPLTGGLMAAGVNAGQRAMTGSQGLGWLRNYLVNQSIPNQGLAQLPQSTVPGMLGTNPYLPRLPDRRNSQ